MKNVRAPLIREYLEVCVTQDTQIENLLVPAGTRLLGLPAPADASGKPDGISLMVPNGSIWAFDTAACRVRPRKLKSSAEPQSDQIPQTVLSELIERQLELVWLALDEVEDDARLSRRTRLNKLYQALAQASAVGGGDPDAETGGDITEAETEIFGLLSDALLESTIPAKQARRFMQPLALWAAASMQAMLTLSTEQCSGCAVLSSAKPGACMVNVARAARINTLYASGLLCQQHPDVGAM